MRQLHLIVLSTVLWSTLGTAGMAQTPVKEVAKNSAATEQRYPQLRAVEGGDFAIAEMKYTDAQLAAIKPLLEQRKAARDAIDARDRDKVTPEELSEHKLKWATKVLAQLTPEQRAVYFKQFDTWCQERPSENVQPCLDRYATRKAELEKRIKEATPSKS